MAFERLAGVIIGRRTAVLLTLVLGACAGIAFIAFRGVPVDFTPQALFTTFEEQADIDARFRETFGSTDNVALLIVRAPDVLDAPVVETIHALSLWASDRTFAKRVESITLSPLPRSGAPGELLVDSPIRGPTVDAEEVDALRAALEGPSLLEGTLISEDRDTTVVAIFLGEGMEVSASLRPAILELREHVANTALPEGATLEVGGLPHIRTYMVERFMRDQAMLIPAAMLVCAVLLFAAFRWWPAVVLPVVAVALTAVFVVTAMAAVGEPFNIINQVVPTLIVVIGISDSIHIVSRYQEELRTSVHRRKAAARTLALMASACLLTSVTTAVGFGSLAVSSTEILARFGVTAAIAVMFAYLVTVTFLPPALTLVRSPATFRGPQTDGWMERFASALVSFALERPWATTITGGAVIASFIFIGAGSRIDTMMLEGFPERDPVYVQTRMIEAELSGVLPLEVSMIAEDAGRFDDPAVLNAIFAVQRELLVEGQVLDARSYGDLLREAWAAYTDDPSRREADFTSRAQVAQLASLLESANPNPLEPWVTSDRRHLRLNVQLRDDGSVATLALADRLTAMLDEHLGGFDDVEIELAGDAYSGALGLDSLIRDMVESLGLAFVLIFAILSVMFRSVRMGLTSLPANAAPLLGTLAYMAVRGIHLNTTTVIIFSISIGLAVDDTIHLMARYREERRDGAGMDAALLRAASGTGRAIMVTSIMLAAGMSVMLLSSFTPVRLFGELVCVTLVMCVLGDLLLLPAMLKLFGRQDPPAARV